MINDRLTIKSIIRQMRENMGFKRKCTCNTEHLTEEERKFVFPAFMFAGCFLLATAMFTVALFLTLLHKGV